MTTANKTTDTVPEIPIPAAPPIFHAELYDAQVNSMLRRFGRFLLRHPSIMLTFGYLLCSMLGMLFAIRLFAQFDFAILPYLELSDYMLAALSHPWILLNVAGWLLFSWVLLGIDRYARRRIRWYAQCLDNYYKPALFHYYNFMFISIPLLFLYTEAIDESLLLASKIKAYQAPMFQVSLIYPVQDTAKTLQLNQVQVIARTSSYLFLYFRGQIKVIPHANVAALLPLSPVATAVHPLNSSPRMEVLQPNTERATADKTTLPSSGDASVAPPAKTIPPAISAVE